MIPHAIPSRYANVNTVQRGTALSLTSVVLVTRLGDEIRRRLPAMKQLVS